MNATDLLPSSKPLMTHHAPVYAKFLGINRCKVIKLISKGAFGKVYLVKMVDFIENQEAALKFFNAGDVNFECEREKSILQHITVHENVRGTKLQIAHIRDDVKGVRCPNLMLEHIDGFDLNHDFLKQYAFSTLVEFVKNMMKQIGFCVLNDLHSMNIYHNDLKPTNIMFNTKERLFYLIDFGLAVPLSLLNQTEFSRANFFTTLQFMSPWHIKLVNRSRIEYNMSYMTNDADTKSNAAKADFWSFGLTIIRTLGMHCHGRDALCLMSQNIVSLQNNYFEREQEQGFIHWNIEEIKNILTPYWTSIRDIFRNHIRAYPDSNYLFMSTLARCLICN